MLEIVALLKGIIIGIIMAAPIGPIGVLCVERTLNKGKMSGLISGAGAVIADILYAIIAAYGLSQVTDALMEYRFALRIVSGIFLLILGVSYLVKKTEPKKKHIETGGEMVTDFLSSFFLAITNPLTIISFGILFAGLTLKGNRHLGHEEYEFIIKFIIIGVAIGASIAWSGLIFGVSWLRSRATDFSFQIMNQIAAFIMIIFAALILLHR